MRVRSALMLLTALAAAACLACSPSEEPSPIPPNGEPSTTAEAEEPTSTELGAQPTTAGTASTPADGEQVIAVSVTGGNVNPPPGPVDVKLGSTVVIEVTSDADDEVHVHGYDITAAVQAGLPSRVTVMADAPGQFEVELHSNSLLLLTLRVQ